MCEETEEWWDLLKSGLCARYTGMRGMIGAGRQGLGYTDGLNDLEDGRSAYDKQEERQQPRSNGVLVTFRFL